MSIWTSGADLISKELEAAAIRLQITLGEAMEAEYKRGQMTQEQLDFILEWMANVPDMTQEEAKAQLEAWFRWRDETHPGWSGSK